MNTASDRLLPLRAAGLSFSYGDVDVLHGVDLSVEPGESLALAGPNGSGKTTLLKLLAGDLRPRQGAVTLGDRPLDRLRPAERARRIAVVPQRIDSGLAFPVAAMVSMGRAPYLGVFGTLSHTDREAVVSAMSATDIGHLADRPFKQLSGGEQQRVALALALAQGTSYLLLDEPTVHLDLEHQYDTLELLERLRIERGIGLLAVMHDLNACALYFDRIAVMHRGELVIEGCPHRVVGSERFLEVFRAPLSVVRHPQAGVPQILLRRGERDEGPAAIPDYGR